MKSNYHVFIDDLKPFKFKEYSGVSSREKLVVFAIKFLTDKDIPPIFDYVCMTAFKLFPEEFKLSKEFPKQADIAGLNRTLMHLRPSERNLATGKPNTTFVLTPSGLALALQVEQGLKGKLYSDGSSISKHDEFQIKKSLENYHQFVKNPIYLKYSVDGIYDSSLIWRIFSTPPFNKMETTYEKVKDVFILAREMKDEICIKLCELISEELKTLIERKKQIEKGVKK
jgi:hypothetical protein